MSEAHYSIQMAARLTGLSQYVIRIWEQRYAAVKPSRTKTNRRVFSQRDIDRLRVLRDATQAGHSIGRVANLPEQKLRNLLSATAQGMGDRQRMAATEKGAEAILEDCIGATRALDAQRLEGALRAASTSLGAQGCLQRVVAPLAQSVGQLWRDGRITAAQEHFATSIVRSFLTQLAKPYGDTGRSPMLIVATPAGQLHEMGALLAGGLAANLGWRVTHLGASLPAVEIAGAARQKGARAVAISLVYPEDDAALPGELMLLRESLPHDIAIIAGGRAMPAYREVLGRLGAVLVEDLSELASALDALRKNPQKSTPRRHA